MAELKELRDKTVFTFFIINALYVTVVFLLSLEKDTVYIRWPLGIEYNMTYVYYDSPLLPTVRLHFKVYIAGFKKKLIMNNRCKLGKRI